jgi:hypothetical protein
MIKESFRKLSDAMPKPCANHRNVFSFAYETLELASLNEKIQLAISQKITYIIDSFCSITGMLQT